MMSRYTFTVLPEAVVGRPAGRSMFRISLPRPARNQRREHRHEAVLLADELPLLHRIGPIGPVSRPDVVHAQP